MYSLVYQGLCIFFIPRVASRERVAPDAYAGKSITSYRCCYIINVIDKVIAAPNALLTPRSGVTSVYNDTHIRTIIQPDFLALCSSSLPFSFSYSLSLSCSSIRPPLACPAPRQKPPSRSLQKGYVIIISDVISESRVRFTGTRSERVNCQG